MMKEFFTRITSLGLGILSLISLNGCQMTPAGGLNSTVDSGAESHPPAESLPLTAVSLDPLSLNGEWRFSIDSEKVGVDQKWFLPGYDDSGWTRVIVPHTWNVMPAYSDYEGLGWYRRTFSIPAKAKDASVRLRFEAVFYLARVWLNGQYLGEHEGGYTPFEFNISAVAQPGQENLLAVQVDNLRENNRIPAKLSDNWSFDWYNYGGITRAVSLEMTSRAFISRQQVVTTPRLTGPDEADSATLTGTVTVTNTSSEVVSATVQTDLLDDSNYQSALSAPVTTKVSVPPGKSIQVQIPVQIKAPKLWHFDHPYLYHWSDSLIDTNHGVLNAKAVTVGIRSIELKNGLFYLNGEPMRLVGVTRHADSPGQGSAETVTAMAADYDDLKTLNEVFTRPVHYPQDESVLDYADRHGILLIPEVPAWQLNQYQMGTQQMQKLEEQQISEMIATDFNHPSVWAWSIGNEIESDRPGGYEFVKDMIAFVKTLDPLRPVGFASNRLNTDPASDATSLSDFVMMNQYFGTWAGPKQGLGPALDLIHQTWPDKTVLISEYGFEPHWNGPWGPATSTLNADQYYFVPDGTASDSEAADLVRQQLIRDQMDIFRSKAFVAGAIFWTYQDYRTRSNFVMGLVDAQRNRRGSWEMLREEYAPVLMDSFVLSPVVNGQQTGTIKLHTRGPIEADMPAYTIRGYLLHWEVTSPDGSSVYSKNDVPLPTLTPGTKWSGDITIKPPGEAYEITVSIIRPTGFSVIDRSYDSAGNLIPIEP